jgi:subtilase family serine protease
MKTIISRSRLKLLWASGLVAVCSMIVPSAGAQSVAPRIVSEINNAESATLRNSLHPMAQAQFDAGRMPADTRLTGVSIVFSRSAAQEAELQGLIAAQQNPSSPLYHQWLTPDQFAARFGMADADLGNVQSWLEQQGFSIDSVARSKNAIRFTGTARQVEQAFSTEMHFYKINGTQHFAPSTALSVPSALAPAVLTVKNLDSFRPASHLLPKKNANLKRNFTGGGVNSGAIFFAPGDIATVYDISPLYNASVTGAGQSITIVGQSAIQVADLEAFQSAALLATKDPTLFLVPTSGSSTVEADGDEAESDLDLEWSNGIAPGATINFVYTGNNQNFSAFDSIQYAIEEKIGTIVSSSYGLCEAGLDASQTQSLEASLEQGTTQGQTFMAAAGDSGSTDCYGTTGVGDQQGLAVDYPASSAFVTGMGGTEIDPSNAAYSTPGQGYWEANTGNSDIVDTVQKYIPEVVWNDDEPNCGQNDCLSATGGGTSTLFANPSWQIGVPGIPSGSNASKFRLVPDLALYASPDFPGFLFCTSDTSFWSQGQESSCNAGFEDSATGILTAAGGTSFDGPIFSGILALINQDKGYTTGQGLINPTLYTLAANSATYASAFHDITSGSNKCDVPANCSSAIGFSAGVGYDQVTGLGSVDAFNLATAWPASSGGSGLIATTTTISASSAAPNVNVADNFTITVTATSGTPTGTVALTVDGGTAINETLASNGTFVYTTSFATAGSHTIFAAYAGDTTYAASNSSVTVNVATVSSGTGTITLTAAPSTLTVGQGMSGNETITVTPAGGYLGTTIISFDTSNDSALQNLCYAFSDENSAGNGVVPITSTAAGSVTLALDANAQDCATEEAIASSGKRPFKALHSTGTSNTRAKNTSGNPLPFSVAFAGLLLVGFLGRRSRKFRGLVGVLLLATVGLAVSACGGVTNNLFPNPPAGTYTFTVSGQDSASSITAKPIAFTFIIN